MDPGGRIVLAGLGDVVGHTRSPDEMELSTARLTLRPYASADAGALLAILRHPDVRRCLLDDHLVERAWVAGEIERSRALLAARGVGQWAIRVRADGGETIVGFAGYRAFTDPGELQLFYGLDPAVWGRGYATEAARELIRHGFEVGGLDPIVAAFDRPNVASRGVLLRAGLRFWRATVDGSFGAAVFYRLRRAEWGKPRVLFVCTHNSARSQMAEGLVRARWGADLVPDSAGTAPSHVHPLAKRAMAEIGVDLSEHASTGLDEVGPEGFDVVVTVCDDAREACPHVTGRRVLHRSFPDPSGVEGSDTERLAAFRSVRDAIAVWLEDVAPSWALRAP